MCFFFFFCKQKTAYEMRISDWSSDVCSSDLADFAAASRREAERMRIEIASAQASGVLGNGRLANLHDARSSSLLNPNGLFLGALNQRLLFYNGDAPLLT